MPLVVCRAPSALLAVSPLGESAGLGVEAPSVMLGLAGGAFLIVLGLRTVRSAFRIRLGGEAQSEVATPGRASSRPWPARLPTRPRSHRGQSFAAASTAGAATTTQAAVLLVVGVAAGSLSWVTALASGIAVARRGLGDRALRLADAVAGLAMLGVGGTLAYATAHQRSP